MCDDIRFPEDAAQRFHATAVALAERNMVREVRRMRDEWEEHQGFVVRRKPWWKRWTSR